MQDGESCQNAQGSSCQHQVSPQARIVLNLRPKCTLFCTKDGTVASFDMRTNSPIFRKTLHKGAVNSLKVVE